VNFQIILLAMVAAFLGLRLYSVLGKRTGHEQEPLIRKPLEETPSGAIRQPLPNIDQPVGQASPQSALVENHAENGLRAIINADRQFDVGLFIEGAKSAYGLVLESFWKGDREALRFLCDDDVYDSFVAAIDEREKKNETLENRLVRIEAVRIVEAKFDNPMARVSVRFDADISALVKDASGQVIGGSLTDAVETNDIWTFMRNIKGTDRNWKLDETDEA
jgi:predicted lipid-binding transport protein (Tim44 family)